MELRVSDVPDENKPSFTAVLSILSNLPSLQIPVLRDVLLNVDNNSEQDINPMPVQWLHKPSTLKLRQAVTLSPKSLCKNEAPSALEHF